MAIKCLNSSLVRVFPSAFRGNNIDPESFLMDERNITKISRKTSSYDNYAYYNDDNDIELCLGGYLFVVAQSDVINAIDNASATTIYVGIKLKELSSTLGATIPTLVDINENSLLDDEGKFKGLNLSTSLSDLSSCDFKMLLLSRPGSGDTFTIDKSSTLRVSFDDVGIKYDTDDESCWKLSDYLGLGYNEPGNRAAFLHEIYCSDYAEIDNLGVNKVNVTSANFGNKVFIDSNHNKLGPGTTTLPTITIDRGDVNRYARIGMYKDTDLQNDYYSLRNVYYKHKTTGAEGFAYLLDLGDAGFTIDSVKVNPDYPSEDLDDYFADVNTHIEAKKLFATTLDGTTINNTLNVRANILPIPINGSISSTIGSDSYPFNDIFTTKVTCKLKENFTFSQEIFSCESSYGNSAGILKSFKILSYLPNSYQGHQYGHICLFSLNETGASYNLVDLTYGNGAKITVSGTVQAETFNATSDRRLKENIKTFESHKSILDLDVVEFDFKDTKQHTIGCIAQELQEICPEIVHENSDGYLTIEENKIVYLLLDEVKKLKEEIKELKGE